MFRRLRENVPLVADVRHDRHHELFADRIYRRVRHLREELVEATEKMAGVMEPRLLRTRRKARKRRIVAHRADGFAPGFRHRTEDQLDVLQRVAETPLVAQERVASAFAVGELRRHDFGEKPGDRNVVLLHPAAIGAAAGVESLDLRILHETVVRKVEPDERTGLEASAAGNRFLRYVKHASFGSEHEQPVIGERPAYGPQAVAVQRRAEAHAVGERYRGRAVPRLHKRRVVFVERTDVVAHVVLCAPCLRNEHHHRVRRVASGGDEQLEHVVERGGIALPLMDHGQELLHIVAEKRRGERGFTRGQGVQVALERVDLAVVRDGAERVSEFPRRERVRGVALMHNRERRNEIRIGKIGVELLDLRRQEKSLVDDRARRARAYVSFLRRLLDLTPNDVEPTLER